MGDEADLHHHADAEARHHAAQRRGAQRVTTIPYRWPGRGGRRCGGRAIGQQADILRPALQHEDGERQQHQQGARRADRRGCGKAQAVDAEQQNRHARQAADAGAQRGDRHGAALVALEPRRKCGRHRRHGEAGPADPHDEKGGVGLPWHHDMTDRGDATGQGRYAEREDRLRTEAAEDSADRNKQQRAHDIEERDRAGDETGRPAFLFDQGVQIDTGAEQAERVGEDRRHQANRDDPPAVEHSGHGPSYHARVRKQFGRDRSTWRRDWSCPGCWTKGLTHPISRAKFRGFPWLKRKFP